MFDEATTELAPQECWELLSAHTLGRLAFHLVDELHITPINYVVDSGSLLFRSAEGSKLLGVVMGGPMAFEIDGDDGQTAWSVVVRGEASLLSEGQAHRADALPLHPWVDGEHKYNVVEIRPTEVTGRFFRLDPDARGASGGAGA